MKKIISVLLSVAILVCSTLSVSFSALANTKKTAQDIYFNQSTQAYVDSASRQAWFKFTPTASGYYEFVCSSPVYSGIILASIYDASDEVLMMNACTPGDASFVTAAELTVGDDYYFAIETDGTPYSTAVTVNYHYHNYSETQNYPAYYDRNDTANNLDGGNYTFCTSCTDSITNAVYYAPASVKVKNRKYTYTGKKKTNSVTVYDRAGNVISPSNYTVSFKNNIKPGTAYATVTFNGANYTGSMVASFLIIPKRQSITYLKSTKSKQFKVKWKKDKTVSGYQVQYSTSKKFYKSKTKTKLVSKKYYYKTLTKLKSKKKYYVRVRAYKNIKGKKVYGSWSKVKSVKVR